MLLLVISMSCRVGTGADGKQPARMGAGAAGAAGAWGGGTDKTAMCAWLAMVLNDP